jgi:uncharacterized membrane protein YgcG
MLRQIGLLALALSIGWLGLVRPAAAVYPPPVKDEGKFFTPKGLEKANAKIKDIYKKYKKDVVVETIDALSVDQEKQLKEVGKDKFWPKYALKRIEDLGVNGVYIVISKKPQFLRLEMDPDTRKTVFTNEDRVKTVGKLTARLKSSEFDEGLSDALDAIDAALKANTKPRPRPGK